MELVDKPDSKSGGHCAREGSSPSSGIYKPALVSELVDEGDLKSPALSGREGSSPSWGIRYHKDFV